ncbi:MAG: bifunctional riboflavin kinase/FAD synthetase [Chlorobium sp.]|uniref:bifunctional riboflavin kinase/FAD synthetase n=1 Tax=Chlorobium sp. TaxID=1095 RepID=UPI001DD3E361|nr:bifunctional riboflavin kinase/FAD synthetase [Chlorobium sp.]MBN1279877.1 bifunctional riboflavin kinase/FAD synthetase [Chlorobiaceae bacterium]MCF8217002.1 bifunctional riboflavin kinase/FAD synthetase [Chlorobium sp.]MCF8271832.1 bifunctional riboflavin kinase/FAD synthetase [Chlorobium sp.]MCF8288219.1 bifunctional riboflavin kinase/FAD synthetase [Chlorobium sp.]MCF8291792.1 bifunctional riboflavin kinase/FAD synthetase [Chlorobium sp.]
MQIAVYQNRQLQPYREGAAFFRLPAADSAVTIGSFDGVHLGHRKIISSMLETARQQSLQSVVVTFDPHPRLVLKGGDGEKLEILTTIEEKIGQIASLGVDMLVVVRFTPDLASWSSETFIGELLVRTLSAKQVTVGYDHGFGRDRSGSGATLAELGAAYGFAVQVVGELRIDGAHVSSTRIRALLHNGEIAAANSFLGAPYMVSGKVVDGRKLGRLLGFPTVNLRLSDPGKLLPRSGVYAATTSIDGYRYKAMMNIGNRPSFPSEGGKSVEAHILGYSAMLYGRDMRFSLHGFLRDEVKFASLSALRLQLEKDKKSVELFFE